MWHQRLTWDTVTGWPPHHHEKLDWTPRGHYPNVSDHAPTRIEVSIPPMIGGLPYDPAGEVARAHESAEIAVARLDAAFGGHLAPLAQFLLRSESPATGDGDPGWSAFGNALAGGGADDDPRSPLASVHALVSLIQAAVAGPVTLAALLKAHRLLMEPDPNALNPGALRSSMSWLGEQAASAVDAEHVAPPPELLPDLLDDLLSSSIAATCRSSPRPPSPTPSCCRSTRSPTPTAASAALSSARSCAAAGWPGASPYRCSWP